MLFVHKEAICPSLAWTGYIRSDKRRVFRFLTLSQYKPNKAGMDKVVKVCVKPVFTGSRTSLETALIDLKSSRSQT